MRFSISGTAALTLFLGISFMGAASQAQEQNSPIQASPTDANYPGETPELRQHLSGSLVTVAPVGGIVEIDLATLKSTARRPSNAGKSAIVTLSEPDSAHRVAFVTGPSLLLDRREYVIHLLDGGQERKIFTGPGDPLWDHAISPVALAPTGGKIAFVSQPAGNAGQQFRPLVIGTLQVLDPTTGKTREMAVTALGEKPVWFRDGRRLLYTTPADPRAAYDRKGSSAIDANVHMLDTETGEDVLLAPGRLPVASSDGKTVLIARGARFDLFLVDIATRNETSVVRTHGLGAPLALIDSRYLIYKGAITPGAPTATTQHNSNFVGAKAMMAIKVMDITNREFATIVPLIDPRSSVAVLAMSQSQQ